MVKIKFCGLKTVEEVRWAEELKADFVGFNLFSQSPRYIALPEIKRLGFLVKLAKKVLVFVNEDLDALLLKTKEAGADIIQLHGEEPPDFCGKVRKMSGLPVIKAFRIGNIEDLEVLEAYREVADYFLLDSKEKGGYGGTGMRFSWDLAVAAKEFGRPIFLAGGLTCENVAAACCQVRPFAVDVASGVEKLPGVKSREKMELFVKTVRAL